MALTDAIAAAVTVENERDIGAGLAGGECAALMRLLALQSHVAGRARYVAGRSAQTWMPV
jgi:hypothetical protein